MTAKDDDLRRAELAELKRSNDLRERELARSGALERAAEEQLNPSLAVKRVRAQAEIRDTRLMPIHVLFRTSGGLPVGGINTLTLKLAQGISGFGADECHAAVACLTPTRRAPWDWRIQVGAVGRVVLSPALEKHLHDKIYTPSLQRDLGNAAIKGRYTLEEELQHRRKLATGPLGAPHLLSTLSGKMLRDVQHQIVPLAILTDPNVWPIADEDLWTAPAIEIPDAPSWADEAEASP